MTQTASQTPSQPGEAGILYTARTGDVHLWSQPLISTTREAPADATTPGL